jgi:hypothetical protein
MNIKTIVKTMKDYSHDYEDYSHDYEDYSKDYERL